VRKGLALAAAGLAMLVWAPSASASFHLMSIREVALNLGNNNAFIELQMYSPGQNFVAGHAVTFYTATGSVLSTSGPLPGNAPNGGNQRTILIGDTGTPGVDFTYDQLWDAAQTYGPGGAACWDTIDCVSWGNFTGNATLPSSAGTPAAAIPPGQSLERTIGFDCSSLLEASDDNNDSATDFALATPSPRNNATAPTETECTGGGGGGDTTAPATSITKAPPKETDKTTAKFKFKSNEANSTFKCKLDKTAFKSCSSPRTYKHLKPGKHKFQVAATDAAGNADKSPAKAKFEIVGD
jgi:hypothetical protein